MIQPLRLSSAASLIALGSILAGCAAQHAQLGAATHVDAKSPELGFATQALAALNGNNVPLAVDFAEKAVARTPMDSSVRTLLANAYFAGGRFASAEAAYRDSLTIDPNQPAAILKLALVEIAQGKDNRAVAMLNEARGLLDASDYGLALALAGRSSEAISVLEPTARQPGADATARQNLALAYALDGNWDEAKVIAGQDVPANELDARMGQWMRLAKPKNAADQVAAVVGVTPAVVDPGQPLRLALNKDNSVQPGKPARVPVELAQASEVAVSVPAKAPPKPAFIETVQPVPVVAPKAAIARAPEGAAAAIVTVAASALSKAEDVLAALAPHRQPTLARAPKPRLIATRALAKDAGASHAVVQLGAYAAPQHVLAAWNGASRKFGALRSYAPMSARFSSAKGTFYRLSVRGFGSVAEAKALCSSLRHAGGTCFVRSVAGDSPVNIALR